MRHKFTTDNKKFSELLKLMEGGKFSVTFQSDLPLVNVQEINNFYDAIKSREPQFIAPLDALNAEQWRKYFFADNCDGYPPEHWRRFAVGFKNKITNAYLHFVFKRSANF